MEKLLVCIMGNRNSGKSYTWNALFNEIVRTGRTERKLYFNACEYVNVFLVSGSPEERNEYIGDLITVNSPRIVLCSAQYSEGVKDTFNYFLENGYSIYVHWLNPGYKDENIQFYDNLGIISWLLSKRSTVSIRNGKKYRKRVREIRDYIYGWASSRKLIVNNC